MLHASSRSLGLLTCLPGRADKDRTSPMIRGPDIEGLSVNPNSGGEPKPANGVKGALASPRSTLVSAWLRRQGCHNSIVRVS